MDISVVIASSRPEIVRNCIKAFEKQQTSFQFEVIVAGDVQNIYSAAQNIKLISIAAQHPNAKRNAGIRIAVSDIIALMDDDAMPGNDWIQRAVEFSRQQPEAVFTGPEEPYSGSGEFAKRSHKILSSFLSELNRGHVNKITEPVSWYDVPFCNCVFKKSLWEQSGGLDETIPWHMDDFHFFFPYRNKVTFLNQPNLKIYHYRYPDSLYELLRYKWKIRKQTGEKLFTHPNIYWAVKPLKISVILSVLLITILTLTLIYAPLISIVLVLTYVLLTFLISAGSLGFTSAKSIVSGALILCGVQLTSAVALYAGFFNALINQLRILITGVIQFKVGFF